jgi:hypothetical protein
MTYDRRRGPRSADRFYIAADYLAGRPVKHIMADRRCSMQTIYSVAQQFDLDRREPERADAIREAIMKREAAR